MLPREVVDEIGISYADADPIFFPEDDGERYALPLPDGQYLTVDGIVEEPTPTVEEDEQSTVDGYTVDTMLLTAAQARDEELETLVHSAVADLLKTAIDEEITVPERDTDRPRTELTVDLSDRRERLLEALLDETDEPERIDQLLDVALRRALDIEGGSVSVELDGMLASAIRTAIDEEESLDEYVAESVKESILGELEE